MDYVEACRTGAPEPEQLGGDRSSRVESEKKDRGRVEREFSKLCPYCHRRLRGSLFMWQDEAFCSAKCRTESVMTQFPTESKALIAQRVRDELLSTRPAGFRTVRQRNPAEKRQRLLHAQGPVLSDFRIQHS